MVSSLPAQAEPPKRRGNDPISWYLQNIGRVPLLTPAEEIELGNQVQKMMILTEDGQLNEKTKDFTKQQKRTIKIGRRAKERMMKANLRLVVSVAKKYQGKGLKIKKGIDVTTLKDENKFIGHRGEADNPSAII